MWNKLWSTLQSYLTAEQMEIYLQKTVLILLILIVTRIAIGIADMLIERTFQFKYKHEKTTGDERRADTLKILLKSVARYALFFIAAITVLDELGVPIAAVLSAAGILGLAVGFGAQNLVKDVITGFFIIFEDQFSVGEYVETEGVGGIVEEVGLRITKLRDWDGKLHIIPNGSIAMVTNHNRGSLRAWVEVRVSYREDLNRVLQVLEDTCKSVRNDFADKITQGPRVLGVTNLGQSEVVITIMAMTTPLEQWGIERELRKRIKETFEREGIEIPYPHQVIIREEA
ncbi:MAG TPA: mechanosensitive ion channel family protein [Peptococcaceae bacterium]|jgi:small-conductance mechanosensitive channel|nr:mechanosensitive ion channel family protein [Clostridia bacterium]HQD54788.1 mechanosensitive ion channel family protein [Peptococcaceae bacterium]